MSAQAQRELVQETKAETSKLPFLEKVGYGVGDTASNFYWQTFRLDAVLSAAVFERLGSIEQLDVFYGFER